MPPVTLYCLATQQANPVTKNTQHKEAHDDPQRIDFFAQ